MWVLGDFFTQAYPELDGTTGEPIFQPNPVTIGDGSSYWALFQRLDGLTDTYPFTSGRLLIDIPQDETLDVTISFDLNRAVSTIPFMCLLASGNPGYPAEVVDQFIANTTPGDGSFETVTLSGLCSGRSALIFLAARHASLIVENFTSDGTFVAPYEIPPWVVGNFSDDILTQYSIPAPPDPDSGLPIMQVTNGSAADPYAYKITSVRENEATPVPGALDLGQGPVVFKELKLDIPPGEIWDVTISGNIDRLSGDRVGTISLMAEGDPFNPASLLDFHVEDTNPSADPTYPTSNAFVLSGRVTSDSYIGFMFDAKGGVEVNFFDSSGSFVSTIIPEVPEFQLTWWEPGSKTYERGVDRGVLYFDDGRVVPWNGLTKVDEQFGIESEPVYFDGVKLSDVPTNDSFFAQVSAITYPDQLEEAYGNLELRNGVYLGEQAQKSFGFCYRNKLGNELTEDAGYKIHIVYNVTALPSSRSYSTIDDSFELTEFSWDFKTTPETALGYQASAHVVIDTSEITPSLLTELEQILYGTPDTPPYLPTLAELIALIDGFNNFINITDNGDGTWTASTSADGIINDLGAGVFEIQHATIQVNSSTSYLISPTPDPPDN